MLTAFVFPVPLLTVLEKQLLTCPVMQCDETVVQILKKPNRQTICKSYMWVGVGREIPGNSSGYFINGQSTGALSIPAPYFLRNTKSHKPGSG